MSSTFTKVHIHFVFATKFREALIDYKWNAELYKFPGLQINFLARHKLFFPRLPCHHDIPVK